jgi:hypothetical protein
MQFSQLPTLLKLAFAALGGKNTIPVASQLPGNINGASYTDGFPPATRTALVAGGKPPAGLDVNGVLFDISSNIRWMNAGGPFPFSSAFATDANVGGYPQGAEIASADLDGTWLSQNDNNTDNPDTGAGTKWVPGRAYGVTAVGGLTNVNVTLTPAQAAKNRITLAGALTGNVQIIFPTWTKDWTVVNSTTGAFAVTCKTAAGTGIAIPQNSSPTRIYGDGTNIVQAAENIALATSPTHAVALSQAQAMQGNYNGVIPLNTSQLLTLAQFGGAIDWFGPSGGTLSLPVAATIGSGRTIKIYNYGAGPLNISTTGPSDFIYNGNVTSITTIVLQRGDDIELAGRSGNEIDITGGAALRQFYPLVVAPATASQHAVQLGQVNAAVAAVPTTGRLLNIQYITSSGSYTPTPGAISGIVEGIGAGGAGGGTTNAGSGSAAAGGGGSSGSWGRKRITSLSPQTVTIGAGGVGVVGGAGGNGGQTSFGSLLVLPGGGGAVLSNVATVASGTGAGGTISAAPTGGDIQYRGNVGGQGFVMSTASTVGGGGAPSQLGTGGVYASTNAVGAAFSGSAGNGFGSGGGGGVSLGASATSAGGNGAPGAIIVYEYSL